MDESDTEDVESIEKVENIENAVKSNATSYKSTSDLYTREKALDFALRLAATSGAWDAEHTLVVAKCFDNYILTGE